ncbi:unnamed protein product [Orchesella dallaii]|uniref:C2H2-type domain-containing protein n=1 Tax=Orchesella dallaii TaxID=48710 RepID=A0ABP1S0X6_9HEXA
MTTRNGPSTPIFISLIDSEDEEEGEIKGGQVLNGGGEACQRLPHNQNHQDVEKLGNQQGSFEGMMVDVNQLPVSALRSIVSSIIKGGGGGSCAECELLSTKAKELENELLKEKAKTAQLEGKLGEVEQTLEKLHEITNTLVGVKKVKVATQSQSPPPIPCQGEREERKEVGETSISNPVVVVSIEQLKVEEKEDSMKDTGEKAKEKETEVNLSNLKVEETTATAEPSSSSSASNAAATSTTPPEMTHDFNGNLPPPSCPPQLFTLAPAPVSISSTTMTMTNGNGHPISYQSSHQVDPSKPEGIFCSCGQQFRTKNNFYYHVKKMTCESFGNAKFSCSYCPKKFLAFGMLKKHLELKHRMAYKKGVVGCRYCGEVFPTRIMLLCHQRVEHKGGHHRLASWYHHHSLVNGQEPEGNGVSSKSTMTATFNPQPPPHQHQEEISMDIGSDDVITIDSEEDDDDYDDMFQAQCDGAGLPAPPSPPTTSESPDLVPNQTRNVVELPTGNGNVGYQYVDSEVGVRRMVPPAFRLTGMPIRLVPSAFTNGRHNYDGAQAQAQAAPPPLATSSTGFVRINRRIFSSSNHNQNQKLPQLAITHENNGAEARELDENDGGGIQAQSGYYKGDDGYTYIDYVIRA